MAIRREAWRKVRSSLCVKGGIHEDYDIAIHLQELGGKVVFDESLKARVSSRRIDVNYLDFLRYTLVCPKTYGEHQIRARWHMYEIISLCAVGYLPARLLHRGYDPATNKFSWVKALSPSQAIARVDPTANVA